MTILVLGATGATGKLLVKNLLNNDHKLKAIVRSTESLSESIINHNNLDLIQANVLDINEKSMAKIVSDCDAVASCLGHNLSFKGIFGEPRLLVTDTAKLVCNSIKSNNPKKPIKYVLMNTAGNSNRDLNEPISSAQKIVMMLIRNLLPPHSDNERASDYLREQIGQDNEFVEWSVVRPDNLTNEEKVTAYDIYTSPIRSAIFDPGKTSRINVAHFMADLVTNESLWNKWKGKMPVIYNSEI